MQAFKDNAFSSACADVASYGFYGREGGVSTGLYASLNCARGSNDVRESIEFNRSIVAKDMGCEGAEISTPWQCHTADCMLINQPYTQDARPVGDALVTDVAGLPIAILT
ncbi:MAG: polyphenol oxidase, partial [Micavibrio aeruginosavorus]